MERVDPSADQVNDAVDGDHACVVASKRHRLATAVTIFTRIVDDVPVDRAAIVRADRSANQMN
jgi:hypothetical protein